MNENPETAGRDFPDWIADASRGRRPPPLLDCLRSGHGLRPGGVPVSRFAPDPLCALAISRRALIENKSRDFAAERAPNYPWPAESTTVLALSDGKPQRMRSREDYNADERRYAHHTLQFRYRQARQRALIGAPLYDLAFREELIRQRRRPSPPAFDFNGFANALMAGDQRGIERALGLAA